PLRCVSTICGLSICCNRDLLLSLHDALPISTVHLHPATMRGETVVEATNLDARTARIQPTITVRIERIAGVVAIPVCPEVEREEDRKSTRLNSSHVKISYAVFCLKKKTVK